MNAAGHGQDGKEPRAHCVNRLSQGGTEGHPYRADVVDGVSDQVAGFDVVEIIHRHPLKVGKELPTHEALHIARIADDKIPPCKSRGKDADGNVKDKADLLENGCPVQVG